MKPKKYLNYKYIKALVLKVKSLQYLKTETIQSANVLRTVFLSIEKTSTCSHI